MKLQENTIKKQECST